MKVIVLFLAIILLLSAQDSSSTIDESTNREPQDGNTPSGTDDGVVS